MTRHDRFGSAVTILLLLFNAACAGTAGPPHCGSADLREDLEFFARELPRRHKNAYHYTPKAQFDAAIAALASRIDSLDCDAFAVGLMRIAAAVGDAHTRVYAPLEQVRLFPIVVRTFGDEVRVVAVAPGFEQALGTRLVKIDDTPSERFFPTLAPLVAQNENLTLAPAWADILLRNAAVLHGAGIIARPDAASFTFESDDGNRFAIDLNARPAAELTKLQFVPLVKTTRLRQIAEPMRNPTPSFSYTYIAQDRAVYADVRSMVDTGPGSRELFALIRERRPDKLIIDLRRNPGGNYFHGLHDLIEPIAKLSSINRAGHLFVLIGPLTGSAAVVNASQFHTMTHAILVGDVIGAKPAEYTELRTMHLPRTHLIVGYSVRFYDFAYNKENVIAPDHQARATWEELRQGRDPALEWCLAYGV